MLSCALIKCIRRPCVGAERRG